MSSFPAQLSVVFLGMTVLVANAARLIANDNISARVDEILAAGAERAEITVEKVLRELAVLGFSDIGKVVRWRPEVVYEEIEDEDNPDKPPRQVLQSRVLVLDSATLPPEVRLRVRLYRG